MHISTRNHGQNQVVISSEDLKKLIEIAEKVEPVEILQEFSEVEMQNREDEFERYLLAKGVASHLATHEETDEEFDAFEPITVSGEPLSETIIKERI